MRFGHSAAIRPTGNKTLSVYFVITVGGTASLVRTDILFNETMGIYGSIQSTGGIASGQTVTWPTEQTIMYRLN